MFWSVVFSLMHVLCPGCKKFPQADKICKSKDCLRTAKAYTKVMNTNVEPCENFYGYVCGKYMDVNKIHLKPHLNHYSPYEFRDRLVHQKIIDYFQTINAKSPKGFQNVKTFYKLCVNEKRTRAIGYNTLQEELNIIGMNLLPPFHSEAEPGKDFATIMGKIHRFSVRGSKFLHDVSVFPFVLRMQQNILRIASVSDTAWSNSRVQAIESRREYMLSVIHHLYEYSKFELTEDMKQKIKKRVDDVLTFEVTLIQMRKVTQNEPQENSPRMVYKKPPAVRAYIKAILEGGEIQIDFNNYLLALLKEDSKPAGESQIEKALANVEFPMLIALLPLNEFEQTYRILKKTNPSVFESFIWWSVVESILDEGPAQLYEYKKRFKAEMTEKMGYPSPKPRDRQCWLELQTYFGNFIGHVLAKTSNGPKKKRQIIEMFENIKESYEESIRRTTWADDETKEAVSKKIQSTTIYAGFDDSLLKKETIDQEYGKIDIQPGNFYKFLATLFRKSREKELQKLFDVNDFHEKPEYNPADLLLANYNKAYNNVVIPITTIEYPFYDLGLEVLNYGITGYIIAHEVAHAVDKKGCQRDAAGNWRNCLSETSFEAFTKIERCFIDAWDNFFIPTDEGHTSIQVKGERSYVENMADWQGFHMAMMAYKKHEEKYGLEPKLTGFENLTPEKLFSHAYASIFCANITIQYLIMTAQVIRHAPEETRVYGVLRNSRQFSDVWRCPEGSTMNPPDKCEIWI